MLGGKTAIATIAVKDLNMARKFYEGALDLKPSGAADSAQVVKYNAGNSSLLVYRSQHAGTNKATAATWVVGEDVEGTAEALKANGVAFEHYDFPGATRKGDIHFIGQIKAAWFKDPDGNIHSIVNG
jgi:catechol 2,3-dioxygenase-like lactoylglutathione lyase family enzyme